MTDPSPDRRPRPERGRPEARRRLLRRRARWVVVYAVLLAISHVARLDGPDAARTTADLAGVDTIPATTDEGEVEDESIELAWLSWTPRAPVKGAPPVLLIHGSPGSAENFDSLAPELRDAGYRVFAVDLPGFGRSSSWVPDYSIRAHAFALRRFLVDHGIDRAHVVGWSSGGGVALNLADILEAEGDGGRLASLTLMAAIGAQETEGSGSYFFEHAKYALGYAVAVVGRELVPDFGLLGPRWFWHGSMRSFWDSDQRPLGAVMERLRTPTLILHGRSDFLVPAHAAEEHHRLIGPSRLVVLDASHFLPFRQPEEAAAHLLMFFRRHDAPGAPALRQTIDLAPEPTATKGAPSRWLIESVVDAPWWLLVCGIALVVAWRPRTGLVITALLVATVLVDPAVGMAGALAGWIGSAMRGMRAGAAMRGVGPDDVLGEGWMARTRRAWTHQLDRKPTRTVLAASLLGRDHAALWAIADAAGCVTLRLAFAAAVSWALVTLAALAMASAYRAAVIVPAAQHLDDAGLLASWGLGIALGPAALMALGRDGRRRIAIALSRARRHEYWPTAVLYGLLSPWFVTWSVRYGGAMTFSCCNPGIAAGGGLIGESKSQILRSIGEGMFEAWAGGVVLAGALVETGDTPDRRAETAIRLARDPAIGGLPFVLKPDNGYRGHAVRIARRPADVHEYFRQMRGPAIVQRYHPGPIEVGVLWARHEGPPPPGERGEGAIFSITRKDFPVVVGDGRLTLERLILRDPRLRRQAPTFLQRFAAWRDRVPSEGERVRLAEAGNHCQGTLFADGEALVTPELSAWIDGIARQSCLLPGGEGGLDMGRFDVRAPSLEALRTGEGVGIIELNGTTGESTNLYDPGRSLWWALGVLRRQWGLMYALGAARRARGVRPMSMAEAVRNLARNVRTRSGPRVSD